MTYDNIKLMIFDVDGTLYNQKKLRFFMLQELLGYYLIRPHKAWQINVLRHFRKEREKRALIASENINIEHSQYLWCQEKVERSVSEIKDIVGKWIHQKPLKYLPYCMYKNASSLLTELKKRKIKTAVYSDYNAEKKIESLGISIDHIYSSEQEEIGALKPNPKGLDYIASTLDIPKKDILFIGDREDRDGACAINAGISYLDVGKGNANLTFANLINYLK